MRARLASPATSALALLALSLPACDVGPGRAPSLAGGAGDQALDEPALPFLQLVADAPERVKHAGVRRVAYDFDVAELPQTLVYTEHVAADGEGHYSIQPGEVVAPALGTAQREIFEELQRARQGFFFKYRDLCIRDLDLFLENYAIEVAPFEPEVAGLRCVEIVARRRKGPDSTYRLAIEPHSGLVLRTQEHDANGRHVASTEFLEISLQPDLTQTEYHVEHYAGTPLSAALLPASFVPAVPQLLPPGFREIASTVIEAEGRRYVRRVYGDGLENLFLLQREPGGSGSSAGATVEGGQRKVRMAQLGAWRIAELAGGGGDLFVVGKGTEDEILDLLASAR